eukprot:6121434-Pyramimonas_sp.AAC.1
MVRFSRKRPSQGLKGPLLPHGGRFFPLSQEFVQFLEGTAKEMDAAVVDWDELYRDAERAYNDTMR